MWAGPAHAEEPSGAGAPITRVIVRGNRFVEEAAVLARIGLRGGDTVEPAKVKRDIDRVMRASSSWDRAGR